MGFAHPVRESPQFVRGGEKADTQLGLAERKSARVGAKKNGHKSVRSAVSGF